MQDILHKASTTACSIEMTAKTAFEALPAVYRQNRPRKGWVVKSITCFQEGLNSMQMALAAGHVDSSKSQLGLSINEPAQSHCEMKRMPDMPDSRWF